MNISDYKELFVWKQSVEVAKKAYGITNKFPKSEMFGLCSQIQRAAVSIPSNIAEGYNRKNRKKYLQFLYIANGSASELETQIIICLDIYPEHKPELNNYLTDITNLRGLLQILIKKLSQS